MSKMFSKFNLFKTYQKFNFTSRFLHRPIYKMDKAYLRINPDGEHFDITFELNTEMIKRKFNLSRKLSENVDSFLTRVKANLDKAVNKKKKKKSTTSSDTTLSIALLSKLNKIEIPKENLCREVFYPGNQVQLAINENSLDVIINSPWVLTLNLPNSILANFPTYPVKFESVFTNSDISNFSWYKSKDKIHWEEVGRGFIYEPNNSDINCYLKFICIPKNDEMIGPEFEVVSSCTVQASPGECPFEKRHAFTKERLKGNGFRVVSYNILADLYCDSAYSREVLFPYCPPYALAIDYRKQLILKELIGYNADITCLQEVDRKVFKYDLEPILSHLGYGSNFDLKGGEVAEGLAFFYNNSRFILLGHDKIVFSEHIKTNPLFEDIWNKIKENDNLANRILNRTTTLQVNLVGSLENDEVLVVANTHLYFHPDADHIRLLHGCLAIRYLENFVKETKERYIGKRVSLIFCGDFNSVPSCGIYKLYTTGFVSGKFLDYSSNQEEAINNIDMTQSFKLQSACGTPKFTNFTKEFADCLDYIFYEATNLDVTQVIPLPSYEELTVNTAIPSIVFPSDHVALVSDLKWN